VKREAYLDTKNTKYEARNSPQSLGLLTEDTLRWKQYQNLNDTNSKLCLDCQIMVYGRVSADTKTCGSPLYLRPPQGKGQAPGGLYLPMQICKYFNTFSYKNQHKND